MLEVVVDQVGPMVCVYMVNEEALVDGERAAPWEHADRCLAVLQGEIFAPVVSPITVREDTEWGAPPEYSFTVPYGLAVKVLGRYRLRGSIHLAQPRTTIYSRFRDDLLVDRVVIIDAFSKKGDA